MNSIVFRTIKGVHLKQHDMLHFNYKHVDDIMISRAYCEWCGFVKEPVSIYNCVITLLFKCCLDRNCFVKSVIAK